MYQTDIHSHSTEWSFRPASVSDARLMTDIQRSVYLSPTSSQWNLDEPSNQEAIQQEHQLLIKTANYYYFVVCSNNVAVGYIHFTPIRMAPQTSLQLQILIEPDHQSKGLGSYLLMNSLDYLIKNTSTKEVRLVVEKQNKKAIHLYKKLDFNALDKNISEGDSFIVMTKTLVA